MAKGSIMLQLEVTQFLSPEVTFAPEIWTVVLDSLDGDSTTVREIATEKIGVFSGSEDISPALDLSSASAFTDLWLVFPDLRRPPKIFYAPSHVPSPQFDGARLVLLRVRDFGYVSSAEFVLSRAVAAHAYVDEV
jgi:hypothetical protein